jgi:hypothetical protein
MTWKEDDTWKVMFPEQKVSIMKHQLLGDYNTNKLCIVTV